MRRNRDMHGNKLHPNKPCGCGSGKKYKKCCRHADWPEWRDGPKPQPPEPKTPEQQEAEAREAERRIRRVRSMARVMAAGMEADHMPRLSKPKKKWESPVKGKFNGACNRTECQQHPATWYNHSTRRYYCHRCAVKINEHDPERQHALYGHDLCTPGEHRG